MSNQKLTEDEVDDVLYLTRVNESEELLGLVSELAQKYSLEQKEVLAACVDEQSRNTVLHYCAANGLTELLKKLLIILQSTPPSSMISQRNASGNTPLHWAALNGHLETTKALVAASADLWLRNEAGNLAVFEAERAGKDDVVAFLLQAGGTEQEKHEEEGRTNDGHDNEAEGSSANGVETVATETTSAAELEDTQNKLSEASLNG